MKKTMFCTIFLLFAVFSMAIDGKIFNTKNYSLVDSWYYSMPETVPVISTTEKIFQDEYVVIAVFLNEYAVDDTGNVDISYDLEIVRPDGKIYETHKNIPGAKRKVDGTKYLLKTEGELRLSIEKDKPLGEYIINVNLHDHVSGKSKKITSSIEIVKYTPGKDFDTDEEVSAWLEGYHNQPSPERAINAYLYYAKSPMSEKESSFVPFFSSMKAIFNENQYLIPEVIKIYHEQDFKTRIHLNYVLYYSGVDSSKFLKSLTGDDKKAYDGMKGTAYVADPYGEITQANQLDALWGEFMGSGAYKPVHRIMQVLENSDYIGAMAKYKASKTKTEEEKAEAIKELMFQTASWSLKSFCKKDQLVFNYCEFALYNDKDLKDSAKLCLKIILKKILEESKK